MQVSFPYSVLMSPGRHVVSSTDPGQVTPDMPVVSSTHPGQVAPSARVDLSSSPTWSKNLFLIKEKFEKNVCFYLFLFGEHCKGRGQIGRDGEINRIGRNDRKHTKIEQKLEKKQIKKIESQLKVGRGTVYIHIKLSLL